MSAIALAQRYASAGWRHRWKSLALAWLVCLLGWAGVYALPDTYQSSARVYADADAILGSLLRGIAIDSSPAGQVEILQRTLLSRPNLAKVIARTDLAMRVDGPGATEELLQRLEKQIRITPQTRNLFTIDYRDSDPRVAHDVVQTALNLFIEAATGTDRRQMENARTFIGQQLASYEVQLREAERRRAQFQARYIDLLPSDALGGSSRLEAARTRLLQLRGELQDARQRRDLTQRQLDAAPPTLGSGEGGIAGGGGGDERLVAADRDLRELRLRFTEQHPDVVAARNAVAALRGAPLRGGGTGQARIGEAPRAARSNPLHEQLKVRMVDADAQLGSLERQERDALSEVERLDAVARSEPEVQAQFLNLDRDYNVLRRNYEELLARRESIQIGDAARTSSDRVKLEVVDPPVLPTNPTGPNRRLFVAGVLVAGLGAGAALALLLVALDGAFYTVHDLRRLGLPVLGGVSAVMPAPRFNGLVAFAGVSAMLLLAFGAAFAGGPALLARIWA